MKRFFKNENGQATLIVTGALVALIAFSALVTDAGNAYLQKRRAQNATDAAAQAGAITLAQSDKTSGQIYGAITQYVSRNASTMNNVKAYYVVQDGGGNNIVVRCSGCTVDAYTAPNNPPPTTIPVSGLNLPVIGIQVEGDLQFNTYFAGLIGWRNMNVSSGSAAFASRGTCSAGGLFPIAVSSSRFSDDNGDGVLDIQYEQTHPSTTYVIWENKQTSPGSFGYLSWDGDTSATALAANMSNPSRSGTWSVGDNIPTSTGTMASNDVKDALQSYVDSQTHITIPIYDTYTGTGSNTVYHIIGFARFRITARILTGNPKSIEGKFQQWVDPNGQGGCTSFGVSTVSIHPPIDTNRTLLGTVKLQKTTIQSGVTQTTGHVPVDVVNVMDISGSMDESFGSKSKLSAAKTALTNFNKSLKPSQGDRVALVTYPQTTDYVGIPDYYTGICSGKQYSLYLGQTRVNLTNITSTVNTQINSLSAGGYTPIAQGLKVGRETVLGAGHTASNIPVIIFASDGLANVTVDGKYTGNAAGTANCNEPAKDDAIDQANIAKGKGITIFSIAVGDNFDPTTLQSIASPNQIVGGVSKTFYYRATDANSMAAIYQQVADRVQMIASETCRVIQTEAFAGGATVVLRNQTTGNQYTVTTNSAGQYVLANADPGTYQFVSATVTINGFTYNVFTNGVGGPDLTTNPTVVVGTGSGTYKADVSLRTSSTLSCP